MGTQRGLAGKVAIVTASTEGIGFAIARRLLQDGAKVMISSRRQENVDTALKSLKTEGFEGVVGMVCHVAKKADRQNMIDRTMSEFGGIDILVSNAAVNPAIGPILTTTETVWDKVMDVNVKSTFFLVKEVVPYIEQRGGGSIVIVSSLGGYAPSEVMGPYSISKTALLGMTKALVPQLAAKNIRVNCLAPGLIKTKFASPLWTNNAADEIIQKIPLGRSGVPEECSGVVSFLVSDDAAYITGETVANTGGMFSRL